MPASILFDLTSSMKDWWASLPSFSSSKPEPTELSPELKPTDFPMFQKGPQFLEPQDPVEADFYMHFAKFCKDTYANENFTFLAIAPAFIEKLDYLDKTNVGGKNDELMANEIELFKNEFTLADSSSFLNVTETFKDSVNSAGSVQEKLIALKKMQGEVKGMLRGPGYLPTYLELQFDRDAKSFQKDPEAFHQEAQDHFESLVEFSFFAPSRSRGLGMAEAKPKPKPAIDIFNSAGDTALNSASELKPESTHGSGSDSMGDFAPSRRPFKPVEDVSKEFEGFEPKKPERRPEEHPFE